MIAIARILGSLVEVATSNIRVSLLVLYFDSD